jgi:hypothetical protein
MRKLAGFWRAMPYESVEAGKQLRPPIPIVEHFAEVGKVTLDDAGEEVNCHRLCCVPLPLG